MTNDANAKFFRQNSDMEIVNGSAFYKPISEN